MKKMIFVFQFEDMSNELFEIFDYQLRDKKLQKLWKKVQFGGFFGNLFWVRIFKN